MSGRAVRQVFVVMPCFLATTFSPSFRSIMYFFLQSTFRMLLSWQTEQRPSVCQQSGRRSCAFDKHSLLMLQGVKLSVIQHCICCMEQCM